MDNQLLITVDGPARSGKGTFSKGLANKLCLIHFDSGLIYRAVGVISNNTGESPVRVAQSLSYEGLEHPLYRCAEASALARDVSQIPEVREAANTLLRKAMSAPGCVIDGRSGAYEFPEATLKIFLWAHPRMCADRHVTWLRELGSDPDPEAILAEINQRNRADASRSVFPLRYDKLVYDHHINCTNLGIEEMIEYGVRICAEHGITPVKEVV